jgi:hypothetical protein
VRNDVFVAMENCGVTSYNFVDRYQLFGGSCCLVTAGNISICVSDVILQQVLAPVSLPSKPHIHHVRNRFNPEVKKNVIRDEIV